MRQTFKGSSTTPQSGCLSFIFSNIIFLLPFLQTIELPFVVITYNCPHRYVNNYIYSLIVQSYVIQRQGVATITASVMLQIQEILTGSTKYQGIDGDLCDNVF